MRFMINKRVIKFVVIINVMGFINVLRNEVFFFVFCCVCLVCIIVRSFFCNVICVLSCCLMLFFIWLCNDLSLLLI